MIAILFRKTLEDRSMEAGGDDTPRKEDSKSPSLGGSQLILKRALLIVIGLFIVGFILSLLRDVYLESVPKTITATYPGVAMEPTLRNGQTIKLVQSPEFERLDL